MTDIKVGYTTSDYFYTLAAGNVPDDSTCETKYNIEYETQNCGFTPMPEIRHCLLDFTNENGRDKTRDYDYYGSYDSGCLRDVDVSNNNQTNYFQEYKLWLDSSSNCYQAALCKNKKYAKKIEDQQTRHLGTNQTYENMNSFLTNEQWKTVQLGLGLAGIIGGIYILNKSSASVSLPSLPAP